MNDSVIKCLSIDDSPVDLRLIRALIKGDTRLNLLGEFIDSVDGLLAIQKVKPDLIFLDYKFNNYNADEIMSSSVYKPKVILVTAYPKDFRLKSIENVVSTIHKPINPYDFKISINKFIDERNSKNDKLLFF